jgi:predicted dehydrogenase
MLKIGFIGLDTSHVEAFARLLMRPDDPNYVPGGCVAVAYPGGSPDFPLSINRVEGYTRTLRDEYGVRIANSPEAVAEQADLVFIASVDGRVHREQFQRVASFGKPVFIDKPLATSVEDAQAILRLAAQSGVVVMSSSSLRYAEPLVQTLSKFTPIGIDVFGPMALEPTQPGFFWYGIHGIEMLVRALGSGCRRLRVLSNENGDLLAAEWHDGRLGTYRGVRGAHSKFGATIHEAGAAHRVDPAQGKPSYAGLLEAILRSLPHGRSDVPPAEMLAVIRIVEAANRSRETGEEIELSHPQSP